MKKFGIFCKLLGMTAVAMICCFMVSNAVLADMVSNAGLIPAGYGYTHGRIPVIEATGRPEIHDAAIMRYDRNSRIRDIDSAPAQNINNQQSQETQENQDQENE